MKTVLMGFPKREDRTNYIWHQFQSYLQNQVLDIGCFEAPMRGIIGKERYTGVDFVGNPDIVLNLEKCDHLPFEDNSYDTVMCMDVLEHLDNFHVMFDELVRVSSRYILISLPNCWNTARSPIMRGRGSFSHYGLPVEQPDDRHKWFFSIAEAINFMKYQAIRHQLNEIDCLAVENPRNIFKRTLRKIIYPGMRYHNRYAHTLIVLLEKS